MNVTWINEKIKTSARTIALVEFCLIKYYSLTGDRPRILALLKRILVLFL
jgi:hypothetical protein